MAPRCDIVPEGGGFLASQVDNTKIRNSPKRRGWTPRFRDSSKSRRLGLFVAKIALQMPYLHWETDESRDKMRTVIEDILSPKPSVQPEERQNSELREGLTLKGRNVAALNLSSWGVKLLPKIPLYLKTKRDEARRNGEAEELARRANADESLLRAHLTSERPVHIRRTLDQSYYWTLKDTLTRDRDQVVYRETSIVEGGARLVMVDQLWLWILDGRLVITSFPRRWGRARMDPSGMYRTIRERLKQQPDLENVYEMAMMMIDQCSRFFFDRYAPRDNRPEVLDIFSTAIGDVTDKATNAYNNFWDLIRPNTAHYRETLKLAAEKNVWAWSHEEAKHLIQEAQKDKQLLEQLLDINPEGELLKEVKDILDELHMMTKVFSEQHIVVKDLFAHLQQLGGKNGSAVKQKTKDRASLLVKEVSRRKATIYELTRAAQRTAEGLKELLDLKQKHANVEEARAAVREAKQALIRAEETNNILAATKKLNEQAVKQTEQGAKQAELTTKQNRSLMIFTIVTIIFLPLGFFSSLFGMNAPEFGQGNFHIWKQFLIMFPISIAIIIFSLSLALSEDILSICGTTIQLNWARFLRKIRLFDLWKKKGVTVKAAIELRKRNLKELYEEPLPM
ncbi:hypothetical protein N431DRAFT_542622 [Stipitochalara longipes BDJ]|nr:hypothetical protein N431DRAFT_542622 [Stipitochalara longipes BDJ]